MFKRNFFFIVDEISLIITKNSQFSCFAKNKKEVYSLLIIIYSVPISYNF